MKKINLLAALSAGMWAPTTLEISDRRRIKSSITKSQRREITKRKKRAHASRMKNIRRKK